MEEKKLYQLFVYCRRNGVSCDAGEHARGEYASDAEAIADLRPKVSWLYQFYDEVIWDIRQDGRIVK